MNPDAIIGPCTLYHADTLEALPALVKAGLVADCVITDAPYPLTSGGATEGGLHERFGGGGQYDNSGHFFDDCPDWSEFCPLLFDALRDPGHCYMMADGRQQFEMQVAARAAGFYHHNLLPWDKGTVTPNRWYMKNCEFTGLFSKGKAFAINECGSKAMVYIPQVDQSDHPTEKPVLLMQYYLDNSTQPGELVMDPFMGSGTTAIAAIRSGRRFVGIEKSQRWFDVAVARVQAEIDNNKQGIQGSLL